MRFSKDFPDQLRAQINLSDVIGKKVALKKKGKDHLGLCPFHNEKTPSFTVSDPKGFYHCFGCGAHGDIITFAMNTENLDFKEAVITLANDHGIIIPFIKNEDKETENRYEKLYSLQEEVCLFFEQNLYQSKNQQALEYLIKRGLSKNDIKKFRLGYALDDYGALIKYLLGKNFTNEELLASGVIAKNNNGQLYDKFRDRVIFPILNKTGKVIAFGGRVLSKDVQPKYLNSSETELFKKGSNLYNYFGAKKAIYADKMAVIVEGYMDVIALDCSGIHNAVAPLGTAVTPNQLKELFRITDDVVLCMDGDKAGIKAMQRVIDIILPIIDPSHSVRFAFLPEGQDPDDFVKTYGPKSATRLFKNAKNLSETLFDHEAKELKIDYDDNLVTPEKKIKLEAKLMAKINQINDANIRKHFTQYYRNRLYELGKKSFKPKRSNPHIQGVISQNINHLGQLDSYGLNMIPLLANYPQLINHKNEYGSLRELNFDNEYLNNLKEEIIEATDESSDIPKETILKIIENSPLYKQISGAFLVNKDLDEKTSNFRLEILILKYYQHQIDQQYQELLNKIDDLETDNISLIGKKQKEIFDYKTEIEKRILNLESEIT